MRILLTILFLMSFSINVPAIEPVNDQQIMFYYQIPIGADKPQSKHQFGLRLDNTSHDPREVVQLSELDKRPAAFDFRMGYDGVQSIKLHGVDYASYLIAKAAEGEEIPAEVEADTTPAAESSTAEPTAETPPATETAEAPAEKGSIQKKLDDLPFGVIFGVILGVGIIAGVGG